MHDLPRPVVFSQAARTIKVLAVIVALSRYAVDSSLTGVLRAVSRAGARRAEVSHSLDKCLVRLNTTHTILYDKHGI